MKRKGVSLRPWLALLAAFLLLFTGTGLGTNGLGLFNKIVPEALGFDRAAFNGYFTVYKITMVLVLPFAGRLLNFHFDKVRRIILLAAAVNALSFVAYGFSSTLAAFYIASVFRAASTAFLNYTTATMIVQSWFVKNQSTALAVMFIGSSVGGLFYQQISRLLMEAFGWRITYGALGIIGGAVAMAATALFVPSPEAAGTLPYGYSGGEDEPKLTEKTGLTFAEAVRTPAFWMLGLALALGAVVASGAQLNTETVLISDGGYSQMTATNIASITMVTICLGKPVLGVIFDRRSTRFGILYVEFLIMVSLVCLLFVKKPFSAYAFGAIFGLADMNNTLFASALTTKLFGTKEYGTIFSFIAMFINGGMAVSTLIPAAYYDRYGAYTGAWYLYLALSAVVTVLLLAAEILAKKARNAVKTT